MNIGFDIEIKNREYSTKSAEEILEFSYAEFGSRVVVTSSFQTQSVCLLYLISKVCPNVEVLFLNTGFHFAETLEFRDRLIDEFRLNVIDVTSELGHIKFMEVYGKLYQRDPDKCCFINKTAPLKQYMMGYDAWITGVRKDQTKNRSKLEVFNLQEDGKLKICPLINWTEKDLWTFHNKHKLPDHPLLSMGYYSIGCAPCTRPIFDNNDKRSGRWFGNNKTECGIHTDI
jgi:phosphoadenosine phosphosulfate reductase